MAKANEKQISGTHYKTPIECWDYIVANDLGYLEGNAIKYITRWRKKNGIEDLRKAQHYLEKLIELAESDVGSSTSVERFHHLATNGYSKDASGPMGGLHNPGDVARQNWYGISLNAGILQDNDAVNQFHLSGGFENKDNVQP